MKWKKWIDLILVICLSLVLIPLTSFFPNNVLREVIGVPFVILFPGYILTLCLFPDKDSISAINRLLLAFGLSMAIVSTVGYCLNLTNFGIRLNPLLASLIAFNLVIGTLASYRRKKSEKPWVPDYIFDYWT